MAVSAGALRPASPAVTCAPRRGRGGGHAGAATLGFRLLGERVRADVVCVDDLAGMVARAGVAR